MTRYRTIVADPPWPYRTPGDGPLCSSPTYRPNSHDSLRNGAGSVKRYGAMTIADLCAIKPPAEDDAHLYLWTTNAFLVEAHQIAAAWGFRQVTVLTWVKMQHQEPSRVSHGTGYYFRGATEHCLFCVRGSLKLKTTDIVTTAHLWPRQRHSVKPDAFYDLVEKASPGPYLEMFARRARFGWDYWGDQSLGTADMPGEVVTLDSDGEAVPQKEQAA